MHFICPCVPKPSLMWPRLPVFVLSSTGLNQSTSSRLKNMNLTVQTRLFTWKGCPERTVRFTTTLLGSAERSEPVASNDCRRVPSQAKQMGTNFAHFMSRLSIGDIQFFGKLR